MHAYKNLHGIAQLHREYWVVERKLFCEITKAGGAYIFRATQYIIISDLWAMAHMRWTEELRRRHRHIHSP